MKKLFLIAIVGSLLATSPVFSQPPADDPPPPPRPERMVKREMMQTMRMWKLTEELNLTEEQAAKFFPLHNQFQNKVEAIRDENGELLEKLKGYIIAEEGNKVEGILKKIEENEMKILTLMFDFHKDAGKILNDIQLGKLILFQHEFPRKMRQMMHGGWDDDPPATGKGKAPGRVHPPSTQGSGCRMGDMPGCQNPGYGLCKRY